MKNIVAFCLTLLVAVNTCWAVTPNEKWKNALKPKGEQLPKMVLASKGKALYSILLPAKPTTQEEKAAADLAQWMKEMAGAEFPIVREGGSYTPNGKEISIGRTGILAKANLADTSADLGNEGYAIAVRDNTLFLLGGKKRGPINAVYALLEEDLGCRWYHRDSTTIPHLAELEFPPVPRRFVPVLEIRDPFYSDAFHGTWSLRNKTNSPSASIPEEWGGYVDYALFVHTYNTLVPPDTYFKEHPEYFSELAGKRQAVQLCLTNPDVLRITISRVKEVLRSKPHAEIISVSPNDGEGYCECAKCKAIDDADGTKAGTLIRFVNAVADAVKDEFPEVRISTLAYLGTVQPPKSVKPRPNVAIQLCTDKHAWAKPFLTITETTEFQKAMEAWAAIGATMHIWDYTVNFSHYSIPMPNMPVVTPAIRFYINHNAKGVMLQGAYQGLGSENGPMRCWVWAKQLWDPSLDTRELMRDFIYGYYGDAADPIWEYNNLLWDMWQINHKKLEQEPSNKDNPFLVDIRYTPEAAFLSKDFLKQSFQLFEKAESLAKDPEALRRVKLAKFPVMYVKLCQDIGYIADSGEHRLGDVPKGKATDGTDYKALLDEFEQIVKKEGIVCFAEGAPDVEKKIRFWRETLAIKPPKP